MYAVIFTATIKELDERYSKLAEEMRRLAFSKYGCQQFVASTDGDIEIAVSYWQSLGDIQKWKNDIQHLEVQAIGQNRWYSHYKVDIAKVERSYEFST